MFDGQIGALEIGIVASTFLFGITTTQTYLYYQLFPRDSKWLRRLVALVWFLELGSSIASLHALYVYTIQNFGSSQVATMKAPFSIAINLIFSEIVFVCTQGYFIRRVQKLSRTWFISTCCNVLIFARFVCCTIAFAEAIIMTSIDQYVRDWRWVLIALLSIGAFADLVIPLALVYFLAVQRSSAIKSTAAIVDKLMLWTIETGLVTGIAAALILVFFLALPGKFAWMSVYMCLPKMFSNSLLANLNSRVKLRAMKENAEVVELSGSEPSDHRNPIHFPHRLGARVTINTQVRTVEDVPVPSVNLSLNSEASVGHAEEDGEGSMDQKDAMDQKDVMNISH